MKDAIWDLIKDGGTNALTDEQRRLVKEELEADSAALMRQCEERKRERQKRKKQGISIT